MKQENLGHQTPNAGKGGEVHTKFAAVQLKR